MTRPHTSSPRPPETHPSLIVRLKQPQHEQAWWDFVTVYESFLRRLARARGVPETHVPDVTNQILVAIATSIGGWNDDGGEASFRRWLGRVARNVVIKYMSRERRYIHAVGGTDAMDLLAQLPEEPDPLSAKRYEHELIVWAAEQVRDEFIETSWIAFWRTMIDGDSVAEVATSLSISPGSIYMSRGRILKRIRDKVSEVTEP